MSTCFVGRFLLNWDVKTNHKNEKLIQSLNSYNKIHIDYSNTEQWILADRLTYVEEILILEKRLWKGFRKHKKESTICDFTQLYFIYFFFLTDFSNFTQCQYKKSKLFSKNVVYNLGTFIHGKISIKLYSRLSLFTSYYCDDFQYKNIQTITIIVLATHFRFNVKSLNTFMLLFVGTIIIHLIYGPEGNS